jgi:hypothetical protein
MAGGGNGHALGEQGDGQHGKRGRQELHGRHRHRVAAAQQPDLRYGEDGRQQHGRQYQAVAAGRRAAARAAGHKADAGQRHREACPCHRACHGVVPPGRDDRDQHGRRADQQRRVTDACPRDAGVLHHDRPAVSQRAQGQHGRAAGGAQPGAGDHQQQDGGRQAETAEGEPGRRQPLQGQP